MSNANGIAKNRRIPRDTGFNRTRHLVAKVLECAYLDRPLSFNEKKQLRKLTQQVNAEVNRHLAARTNEIAKESK